MSLSNFPHYQYQDFRSRLDHSTASMGSPLPRLPSFQFVPCKSTRLLSLWTLMLNGEIVKDDQTRRNGDAMKDHTATSLRNGLSLSLSRS
ncbi:unnamed protein product [Tilletia controversa]|nr:unnamed protein product [Tilletia controversa]